MVFPKIILSKKGIGSFTVHKIFQCHFFSILMMTSCGSFIKNRQDLSVIGKKPGLKVYAQKTLGDERFKLIGTTPFFIETDRRINQTFYTFTLGKKQQHVFPCDIRWADSVLLNSFFSLLFGGYVLPVFIVMNGYDYYSENMFTCDKSLYLNIKNKLIRQKPYCPKIVILPPFAQDESSSKLILQNWLSKNEMNGCAKFLYDEGVYRELRYLNITNRVDYNKVTISDELRKKIGLSTGADYYAGLRLSDKDDRLAFINSEIRSLHTNKRLDSKYFRPSYVGRKQLESSEKKVKLKDMIISLIPNSTRIAQKFNRMGLPTSAGGYLVTGYDQEISSITVGFKNIKHPDGFANWALDYNFGVGYVFNNIAFKTTLVRDNFFDNTSLDERLGGMYEFLYQGEMFEIRSFLDAEMRFYSPLGSLGISFFFGPSLIHYKNNIEVETTSLSSIWGTMVSWENFLNKNFFTRVDYSLWEVQDTYVFDSSNNASTPGSIYFNINKNYSASFGLGYFIP